MNVLDCCCDLINWDSRNGMIQLIVGSSLKLFVCYPSKLLTDDDDQLIIFEQFRFSLMTHDWVVNIWTVKLLPFAQAAVPSNLLRKVEMSYKI